MVYRLNSITPDSLLPQKPSSLFFGCAPYGIFVPLPGIEPGPLTVKAPSSNHWTAREFPSHCFKVDLSIQGFPGGSDSKASAYNAGDPGSIPGLGRSPGEGNGNPLLPAESHGQRNLEGYSPWAGKNQMRLSN